MTLASLTFPACISKNCPNSRSVTRAESCETKTDLISLSSSVYLCRVVSHRSWWKGRRLTEEEWENEVDEVLVRVDYRILVIPVVEIWQEGWHYDGSSEASLLTCYHRKSDFFPHHFSPLISIYVVSSLDNHPYRVPVHYPSYPVHHPVPHPVQNPFSRICRENFVAQIDRCLCLVRGGMSDESRGVNQRESRVFCVDLSRRKVDGKDEIPSFRFFCGGKTFRSWRGVEWSVLWDGRRGRGKLASLDQFELPRAARVGDASVSAATEAQGSRLTDSECSEAAIEN